VQARVWFSRPIILTFSKLDEVSWIIVISHGLTRIPEDEEVSQQDKTYCF